MTIEEKLSFWISKREELTCSLAEAEECEDLETRLLISYKINSVESQIRFLQHIAKGNLL